MNKDSFISKLTNYGQTEFAALLEAMSKENQDCILQQADLLDMTMLENIEAKLNGSENMQVGASGLVGRGEITPLVTLTMDEWKEKEADYRAIGLEAVRAGKVGALMLGGGMGTRLGHNGPKGVCDIGITKPTYIFQRLLENLMDVTREAGAWIHLFIMTSDKNDTATREFLAEKNYFGYNPEYIHFFVQDMAPCLTFEGKMFLESENLLAMSPNGNGGFYSSLLNAGFGKLVHEAGIEYINVFAVDNVLQRIADPVFTGAVIKEGRASGAKVVRKVTPDEKVGAICLEDGSPSVVEYYEMTKELMEAKLPDGAPAYNFGVILNYLFSVKEMDAVAEKSLPVHCVKKKIPYLGTDETGNKTTIKPDDNNGYKLETLALDMVHFMPDCLSFEVDRNKEFAPIKNPTGIDSVESARELLKLNGIEL